MVRLGRLLVLVVALSLAIAGAASAATRYAAPGGTGADPCTDPAAPCSIYTAADYAAPGTTIEAGDVVELAPGTYSEADEDLGPSDRVQPPPAVVVRGTPGAPRPLIVLEVNNGGWGAFFVGPGTEILDVEIRNQAANGSAITNQGGVINRVIARSTVSTSFTCTSFEGTMLSSACINSAGGTAIGVSTLSPAGTYASILRNSTFIATGPGSVGMDFAFFASNAGVVGAINGLGVIAKGEAKDVIARGLEYNGSGQGATTTIELQASDYATTETKTSGPGTAIVAAPGTNGNITAPPLLAADNVHQLAGSPTIDKGAIDGASGPLDIDGQAREIGIAPDIGADELGNPTTTTLKCSPATVDPSVLGSQSICTATVEDVGIALTPPTGEVTFTSTSGLSVTGSCVLTQVNEAASFCSAIASPTAGSSGVHTVTAVYGGDSGHEGSEGSAAVTLEVPAAGGGSDGGGGGSSGGSSGSGGPGNGKGADPNPAPVTQLGKHPPKRTKKRRARFTFASNEAGSSFECKLDGKPFKACASPYKKRVKIGKHVFKVRAVDSGGKEDATPVVFRWRVVAP
ncbi:MAG TPA: Ig-like domain-containing protein [Solirubrobacterales bacterium]|nr:Ig-like domain-containing protein [Solirubrobacterales bacterium]